MLVLSALDYVRFAWIPAGPDAHTYKGIKNLFEDRLQIVSKCSIVSRNETGFDVLSNGDFISFYVFVCEKSKIREMGVSDLGKERQDYYENIKSNGGRYFLIEFHGSTFSFKEL